MRLLKIIKSFLILSCLSLIGQFFYTMTRLQMQSGTSNFITQSIGTNVLLDIFLMLTNFMVTTAMSFVMYQCTKSVNKCVDIIKVNFWQQDLANF